MFQLLQRLLSLLLCTLLLFGNAAMGEVVSQNASFWISAEGASYPYPQSMAAIGEALYLLSSESLYVYRPGDEQPLLLTRLDVSSEAGEPAQEEEPALEVTHLFVMDGCLYGFGQSSGQVTRLISEAGEPSIYAVCTLSLPNEVSDSFLSSLFFSDGQLYLLWNSAEKIITAFPLEAAAQPRQISVPGVIALSPYQDGKLLALTEPQYEDSKTTPGQLAVLDPADGALETLCTLDASDYSNALCYDAQRQIVYYWLAATVYAYSPVEKTSYPCVYAPERGSALALLANGALALQGYSGVYLRQPSQGAAAPALSVAGEYGSPSHMAVVAQHPEMAVTLSQVDLQNLQTLTSAMVAQGAQVDVLRMSLSNQPVEALISKGYAMALDDFPQLMEIASQMDSRFLEPFQIDGKLYGLPISLSVQTLTVDVQVWTEKLGLSLEELPSTFEEFLDFVANYSYDYGEDHEDLTLVDTWDLRAELLNVLLQNEVAYQMRQGSETFAFDTPRFHKLLSLLDAIDYSDISASEMLGENATDEDYGEFYSKQPVFSLYNNVAAPSIFSTQSHTAPLALALEEGLEPVLPAELGALLINPKTAQPEAAAAYVASYFQHLTTDTDNVTLFPEHNDPVPNPNYATEKQALEESLSKQQAALAAATPDAKPALQESLDSAQESLEDLESYRYSLTAENIKAYRAQVEPLLYPIRQTPLTSFGDSDSERSIQTLLTQYSQKAIDSDSFIRELNNRVALMQLENQ